MRFVRFYAPGRSRIAKGPAAKIFVGGVDPNTMRNVHKIVKADSSVTCQDGAPTDMALIVEFAPASIRRDNESIEPDPRAE
jgi:hypothetical protein